MRIKNDGFDNEYINGYEKQEGIVSLVSGGWKDKWEKIGKKEVSPIENLPSGKMYTNADNTFKYSKKLGEWNDFNSGDYEDPSFLGFSLMFDDFNSPLWNFGDYNSNTNTITVEHKQTPSYFLSKYDSIDEISKRKEIYDEFLKNLNSIFARYGDDSSEGKNKNKKQHYIEMINGLDRLNDKMVKYPDTKLTIQLTDDISMRTTYLAELYNNLIYSYKNQRNIIPENLLRFDLVIEISDIRVFRKVSSTNSETNTDPARIIYTLHDCNFDFTKTMPFETAIQVAGFDFSMPKKSTVTSFDIKYKSVSKEFKTTLIKDSYRISNKVFDVCVKAETSDCDTTSECDRCISDRNNFFKCKIIKGSETTLTATSTDPSFSKKLGILASSYLDDAKGQLINKFHEVRGELINKTLEDLRNSITYMPKIFPDNVYSTDFRKLSAENFARGIGSDLLNDALGGATRGINTSLGF